MPKTYIIGLLLLFQVAGCATSRTAPVSGPLQGGTVVVERLPPAAVQGQPVHEEPRSADTPGGTLIIERLAPLPEVEVAPEIIAPEIPVVAAPPAAPVVPAAAALPEITPPPPAPPVAAAPAVSTPPTPPAPVANNAAPDKPAAKLPAKVAAPVLRAPPPQPSAAPARAAASTLDLDALEKRLKDTDAIGVFTKIALKNQVDDLLKRFKAYHERDGKAALAQLRQSYDQLLLKVNDVLKSGDPKLADEIMDSREAIWGVLSDPLKFAKL